MAEKFTYDPTTSIGRVRLIIADRNPSEWLFDDAELQAFLDLFEQDIFWASAQALDMIAISDAMIQKRIKLLNLTNDGPTIADQLRQVAIELRRTAEKSPKDNFDTFDLPKTQSEDYV